LIIKPNSDIIPNSIINAPSKTSPDFAGAHELTDSYSSISENINLGLFEHSSFEN
jgi:hypothetical protein